MDLSGLYYGLLIIGFALVFIPPVVVISGAKHLSKEEFGLKIFTPQLIGFILMAMGFYGALRQFHSDKTWQALIIFTASGAIFNSVIAMCQSMIIQRWQAD